MITRTNHFPSLFLIPLALSLPFSPLLAQPETKRAEKKGDGARIIEVEVKRDAIRQTKNAKKAAGDEGKALSSRVELEYVTFNRDKSLLVGYYQDGWFEMVSLHDAETKKQLASVYCDGGVPTVFRFSKDNRFLGAKTGVGWYVWKIPSFEKVFVLGDIDIDRLIEGTKVDPSTSGPVHPDTEEAAKKALSQRPLSKGTWSYKNGKPESVTFDYGTELTAEDIDRLSGFGSIARINMGYAGIDSEYVTIEGELLKLAQLKNLQEIHLCKDGINDDDLRFVALLPKIHTLEFNADNGSDDAPICTDGCADHLSAAKTLRKLVIHDGQFTDKFVATITKQLSGLEELWLNSPELTDESLRLLADRCKKLKTLRIASDHFTAEGLKHLDHLKHLEKRSVTSPALRKERRELQEGTPRTAGSPPHDEFIVYAKILLPGKAPAQGQQTVESWIAREIQKLGAPEIRAVTGWVRLPKGEERSTTIWNGVLDGKGTGCIVDGHVGSSNADGNVRVTLSGWAPFPPTIEGDSLPAEIGSRRIAVVNTGRVDGVKSYVALMIAPALQTNSAGVQDGARQPVAAPGLKAEDKQKPKPESEPRSADPPPKDYSIFYEKYTPLEPTKDAKTGFVVGGKNDTEIIKGLTEINGIPIRELEESMRPQGLSTAGFLGKDEGLLEVLAADNDWVLGSGLTHQELARHLNVLSAISHEAAEPREESEIFIYRGVRFITVRFVTDGFQESPFRDGTKENCDVGLTNVDNGEGFKFSPLVPKMVERYGFYEGHGTSYRVDPRDIVKVLTFLKVKKNAKEDGADQPATVPGSKAKGKENSRPESKGRSQ